MKNLEAYYKMVNKFWRNTATHPLLCGMEFMPIGLIEKSASSEDKKRLADFIKDREWNTNIPFEKYLYNSLYTLVVTTPDEKIEWASKEFEKMTGYNPAEVIGKKPSFLQGEKTDPLARLKIKEKILQHKPVNAELINYRKNGAPYLCSVRIEPIFNKQKKLVNFIAIEKEVF